jgi:hypothetical protein
MQLYEILCVSEADNVAILLYMIMLVRGLDIFTRFDGVVMEMSRFKNTTFGWPERVAGRSGWPRRYVVLNP